ncbi:MAG: nucleotidyl transferase AbiEii/AbiGii toxin family protein [Candidatus Woesearchaeota archaeon]|nr:nucleotidyl transferase AbiEii/AbiGii toxin family protein [Candidatus Woesearchaeota archaeon]
MLELREKEILRMLEKLKGLNFVLIGGYAINTYAQPRFSVDCDLVVLNKEDAGKIKKVLEQEGYKEKEINPDITYSGDFLCLAKNIEAYAIPFDVMIGNVMIGNVIDRDTKLKFPAEWIFNNSKIRVLVGKANPVKIELRIADPEILVIMKLAASRKSDLRDIFMLLERDINMGFILSELKKYRLQNKLAEFKEYAISKEFRDSLQGVFGKVDDKTFKKIVEKIRNL